MNDFFVRTSSEVEPLLKRLAEDDMRSLAMEIAWLIRSEYERRYGSEKVVVEAQNQDISEI